MRRKGKKICLYMAVLVVFLTLNILPVFAASGDVGSIRIRLKDLQTDTSNRDGVVINVWKVGYVDEYGTPGFEEIYGISKYPQDAASSDKAAAKLASMVGGEPDRSAVTDSEGVAVFRMVEQGVYLIQIAEKNPYGNVTPFLVQLPYWEEVDGQMQGPVYSVDAEPKASPYPKDTPQSPKNPPKDTQKTPKVKTGDTAQMEYYLMLLVLAVLTAVLAGVIRRKTK